MSLTVAILAVPRLFPLDVTLPAHVLSRHSGYRVMICGDHSDSAVGVRPDRPVAEAETADVVIVPGYEDPHLPVPDELLKTLRLAGERGARIVAVCTGVFAVAAAGMLDGRTATTHWRYAARLRALHPGVDVVENRLLAEDGAILTSAGATAGVDACLHLIRSDFGAAAADEVARDVVFSPGRGPDEPQYSEVPTGDRATLRATREWVSANLGETVTVQRMADRSHLPRRTFYRRFAQETGMAPMQWVILQRLFGARRLLETSDWPIERIASATGFGTAANLRAVFRREMGVTPSAYRSGSGH
jgi:transcriptional regulator GlxA family with amidase domain